MQSDAAMSTQTMPEQLVEAAAHSVEAVAHSVEAAAHSVEVEVHKAQARAKGFWKRAWVATFSWLDTAKHHERPVARRMDDAIDWTRIIPFIGLHLACFAVIWVGFSWSAFAVAVAMYLVRMFAITGLYHRYFSHKSFKTSRVGQFIFGVMGAAAVQRGPIWWAAHHRHHHVHSDQEADIHSPSQHGFLRSHMGWFLSHKGFAPDLKFVKDLMKFPELRILDRFDILVPVLLGVATWGLGVLLAHVAPGLGTNGWQMLVWGFFVSTVFTYHATYTINSLSHVFGKQRYKTGDTSRNNWFLALLTLGEGWHNNHHYYPNSVRQGFYWWEIDITFYVLKVLSWLGIIWDLKPIPLEVREHEKRRIHPRR
jgi:stearoyl-CoA desaturase (Delta-9 desaturase)